jgi:hypothetical protein
MLTPYDPRTQTNRILNMTIMLAATPASPSKWGKIKFPNCLVREERTKTLPRNEFNALMPSLVQLAA